MIMSRGFHRFKVSVILPYGSTRITDGVFFLNVVFINKAVLLLFQKFWLKEFF